MNSYPQQDSSTNFSDLRDWRNWTLAIAALMILVCSAGCDMGTYNKRLNDRAPSPAMQSEKQMGEKMEKKMDKEGSTAKTESEEGSDSKEEGSDSKEDGK